MPPLYTQRINSDGFEIRTNWGLIKVILNPSGSNTIATIFLDGVQKAQATFPTSQLQNIEDAVNSALQDQCDTIISSSTVHLMFSAIHIFSLSPLNLRLLSSVSPISGQWWL